MYHHEHIPIDIEMCAKEIHYKSHEKKKKKKQQQRQQQRLPREIAKMKCSVHCIGLKEKEREGEKERARLKFDSKKSHAIRQQNVCNMLQHIS